LPRLFVAPQQADFLHQPIPVVQPEAALHRFAVFLQLLALLLLKAISVASREEEAVTRESVSNIRVRAAVSAGVGVLPNKTIPIISPASRVISERI